MNSSRTPQKSQPKKTQKGERIIGIDLGDRWSHDCLLNQEGEVVEEGRFRTAEDSLRKQFGVIEPARMAIEAGTHSLGMSEHLRPYGHAVLVAPPSELPTISRRDRQCDRVAAEKRARSARFDPGLLHPISHRSLAMPESLTVVRARDPLVRVRTERINAMRGFVKACGRWPSSASSCFAQRCLAFVPPGLLPAVSPLLAPVEFVREQIKAYDRLLLPMAQKQYPETKALSPVQGVGTLTALTYVLTIADKHRFRHSRDVGGYLGLRPKRSQSGEHDPPLGITRAGNSDLRCLLTECAHYIVGPFGQDSARPCWGRKLAARGGQSARACAVTAVARKWSVWLHRLWVTGEPYQPFPLGNAA